MKTSIILDEISLLTSELARDYPEIFRSLEEDPFPSRIDLHHSVTENDMGKYLDSLKKILYCYKMNHQDTLVIYQNRGLSTHLSNVIKTIFF